MSYGLYIGKNLTSDGHAWLAGYGDEPSSHWLEIVPEKKYKAKETISVGVTKEADMPGKLIKIPQVPQTYKHIRVSYSYYLGAPAPLTKSVGSGRESQYGVPAGQHTFASGASQHISNVALEARALVMTKDAVATVKLMDMSVESEYQINRQGTLIVSKYAMGHNVLRPACAVSIHAVT